MSDSAPLLDRAAQLRAAFDQSFAAAPPLETDAIEQFLAIRIAADRYALRLSDVSGLFADKPITWLPSPMPELLGIAGFRGTMLPVYDLGALVGYARTAAPRWLLVAAAAPLALAFEGFDGYLTLRGAVVRPEAHARHDHVRETLQADLAYPVIHVTSVLNSIRSRVGHDRLI